ncbi:hypothetical protein Celaphus_00010635 [Cervus elaphus hippelaphus]|uniref:Uncharacterized protein n=1 Tax=Cervus elaphus hippelaphus TaxID=46360 RepID=A0A212CA83_CEREH|nr:hypothetical protein Celaphus_00010635 [Cervus elaphus hippelaphus]
MKGRQRRAGSRGPPSSCRSSAWSWSPPSMTGAKRNSSGACRAALSRSRSSLWSGPARWSRSLWLRSWLGTSPRSNMATSSLPTASSSRATTSRLMRAP